MDKPITHHLSYEGVPAGPFPQGSSRDAAASIGEEGGGGTTVPSPQARPTALRCAEPKTLVTL